MDSDPKYIGKGVVLILTAVILIFLLVYFINNKPGNRSQIAASSSQTSAEGGDTAEKLTTYGVQIGDNLKGFLKDADFFDVDMNNSNLAQNTETGEVLASATGDGTDHPEISFFVQAGEGTISITFVDEASCVLTGERLSVALSKKSEFYTAELSYVDEDGDGVITAEGLSPGIWEMRVNTLLGYRVPTEVFEVALDVDPDEAGVLATEEDTAEDENANNTANEDDADEANGAAGDSTAGEASSN